jgi:Zn-dependent M28 family amino/carboxypeptidase
LLATDQEESGLYGAKAFLTDEVISKQQILLNINLDMIAQPGKKWRLYIAGTRKQPEFIGASDEAISASPICVERGLDYPSWNYNRRFKIDWRKSSDHYVFAKQDIPWLYLGAKDYRYYHTPRDTVDKIPQAFYFGSAITAYQLVFAMDKHFSGFQ